MNIPFNRAVIAGREMEYIAQAITAGHISGDGTFTKKTHALLEGALGVPKALLTTSCTHALEMMAITVPSIINLIELLASIAVPGLLLPLILALRTGQRGRGVRRGYLPDWTLIVVPMVTALLTHLVNNLFLHVVEPMFAGILVSVFLAPFITREHVYN